VANLWPIEGSWDLDLVYSYLIKSYDIDITFLGSRYFLFYVLLCLPSLFITIPFNLFMGLEDRLIA
jgi:hypothetical protein